MFLRFLLLFLFAWQPSVVQAQEELPFWRRNAKLFQRIRDYRKIVVSVDSEKVGRERRIRVNGVGVVNVPLHFALEQVMNFEELPGISSYFKKVVHRKEKKEVYFFIKAIGTQVRFIKQYKWGIKNEQQGQMDWIVTWGTLKGMVGHYGFRAVGPNKTEVVIWANLKKLDIPLPEFLVNFTLEVIAEKVAQKMRSFIEDKYRKSQAPDQKNVKK